MDIKQKLGALRAVLKAGGADGLIVPRADEYQGEYIPESSDRLRWISGFTGSAGYALVMTDRAAVFSDGRYTIQLKQEVDPSQFETCDSTRVTLADWLDSAGLKDAVIGYDPALHTPSQLKALLDKGVVLRPLEHNPVDVVWKDRPAAPSAEVELFPVKYAGRSAAEKLDMVAGVLAARGCDAAILTLPDSIAWLLNVRSFDIPHIPAPLSRAVVHADGTIDWFIDDARVSGEVRGSFSDRVRLHGPDGFENALKALSGSRIIADGKRASAQIMTILAECGADIVDTKDPTILLKARKNEAEQNAIRAAHLRDGAALTRFLKWLSEEAPKERLTEIGAEAKLEEFRRAAPEFREGSFDTIAGFGAHGAIIHYRASEKTNAKITSGNLLLLDSGGQYIDGTTDVTRTVAVGETTKVMKEHFTLVLKGHIALATAKFPEGTTGAQLDALARAPLWQHGLDYPHGTGHGVGCYLSVHEEAAGISPRGTEIMEEGMILSNEPGYYEEGAYGIRCENLMLVREDGFFAATDKKMLSFETLTLAPFDRRLIVRGLLNDDEAGWLNAYHARVYETLSPLMDAQTRDWLFDVTREI